MSHRKRMPLSRLLLAAVFLSVAPSGGLAQVVHLHNSDSEQLARQALSTFGTLEAPDTSMFGGMLRNLDAARQRNLAVVWERGQATLASKVDRIVEWNWNTFSKEVEGSQDEFITAYRRAALMRQESSHGLDALAARIKAVETELNLARQELAREDAGEREMSRAVEHYETAASEIQKIAADPELSKKVKNLHLQNSKGYLKKLQELAKQADTSKGLQPVYLDLGITLVMLELDALKTELSHHRWALAEADKRLERLKTVVGCEEGGDGIGSGSEPSKPIDPCNGGEGSLQRGDLGMILRDARPRGDGLNAFAAKNDELIMVTLQKLARKAHQEGTDAIAMRVGENYDKQFPNAAALRELLDRLATYASIVGYQRFLLEVDETEDDYQARRETMVLTQIENQKLEVLLTHTLQGLLAYHGGGIRPWEVVGMAGGMRP